MPVRECVERGLRHANMTLDSHYDDLGRGGRGEMPRDGRHPHAEGGLVGVFDGIGDVELGAGGAEASGILGCDVNRDREDGSCADELLGGKDSGWFLL